MQLDSRIGSLRHQLFFSGGERCGCGCGTDEYKFVTKVFELLSVIIGTIITVILITLLSPLLCVIVLVVLLLLLLFFLS